MYKKVINGKAMEVTTDKLKQIDREQTRRRISPDELEALINGLAAVSILSDSIKTLEPLLSDTKRKAKAKSSFSMLSNALVESCDIVSLVQLTALEQNLRSTKISVSSYAMEPTTTTMDTRGLETITKAAQGYCKETCLKRGAECRACELRAALDTTFCVNTRKGIKDNDFCPYLL